MHNNFGQFNKLFFFFSSYTVKACAIPCPHQPPTRSDNTDSVAQAGTATPDTTKQLLPPDRVFKRIVYARSTKSRDYIVHSSSFLVQFVIFKNMFTFGCWFHYMLTVTVSWCYVITWEWWFRMHFIHAEDFSLSTKSNLMHIAPWSEDDMKQLSNCDQWFLFLKETKWLSVQENDDNWPQ